MYMVSSQLLESITKQASLEYRIIYNLTTCLIMSRLYLAQTNNIQGSLMLKYHTNMTYLYS